MNRKIILTALNIIMVAIIFQMIFTLISTVDPNPVVLGVQVLFLAMLHRIYMIVKDIFDGNDYED